MLRLTKGTGNIEAEHLIGDVVKLGQLLWVWWCAPSRYARPTNATPAIRPTTTRDKGQVQKEAILHLALEFHNPLHGPASERCKAVISINFDCLVHLFFDSDFSQSFF